MKESDASSKNNGTVLDSAEVVGRVRAVLLLGGVPFDDLEDGMQQVRVKFLEAQRQSSARKVRDPGAWASVVASRLAADWHRSNSRDTNLRERLAARWSRTPSGGDSEDDRTLALSVADGLQHLTARQRQVLVLRFYADLPVSDIASLLGVAEGTIKSRLHSAVGAMRARLSNSEVI